MKENLKGWLKILLLAAILGAQIANSLKLRCEKPHLEPTTLTANK